MCKPRPPYVSMYVKNVEKSINMMENIKYVFSIKQTFVFKASNKTQKNTNHQLKCLAVEKEEK